jgi:hypothetical protein
MVSSLYGEINDDISNNLRNHESDEDSVSELAEGQPEVSYIPAL